MERKTDKKLAGAASGAGRFRLDGSWDAQGFQESPLTGLVANLASRVRRERLTPQGAAEGVLASHFESAFPSRHQWAGLDLFGLWASATCSSAAESAIRQAAYEAAALAKPIKSRFSDLAPAVDEFARAALRAIGKTGAAELHALDPVRLKALYLAGEVAAKGGTAQDARAAVARWLESAGYAADVPPPAEGA